MIGTTNEILTEIASIDNLRTTVPEALRAATIEASEMLRGQASATCSSGDWR